MKSNAQTGSYSLWYEYGNGKYVTKSFNAYADLNTFLISNLPEINDSSDQIGLKKVTPIYRPTDIGNTKLYAYRPTDPFVEASFVNNSLPEGKNLFVSSSTRDFLANDTVMFALHYKSVNPENKKLAFFYNSNPNQTFIPISNLDNQIPMVHDVQNMIKNIPQIRMHNNESVSTATSSIMRNAGAGFKNGLVFNLASITDPEKCIFLTMNSVANIVMDQNENFKLVFLDQNDNALESENSNILNHAKLKSHDPNYEKVKPECVEFPSSGGSIMHYDVHFQNTGLGPALTVETTTTLPKGYTINDITDLNSLDWEIAKKAKNPGYTIDISGSRGNQLVIKFTKKPSTKIILKGTLGMSDPLSDVTTMGDFSFNLRLKNPLSGPMDLKSSTSIVFDTNEPVITNEATVRVRKCCSCKEKEKKQPKNGSNKPCKSNNKMLQWLLCNDC